MKRIMMTSVAVAAAMATDMAAYQAKAYLFGDPLTKDGEPSLAEIQAMTEKMATTFEAFKEKNDKRLTEIEAKGTADPVTQEELRAVQDEMTSLKSLRDDMDKLAKKASRPGGGGGSGGDQMTAEQKEHRDAFILSLIHI